MNRVFVYGTLLRGESNHDLLLNARFIRQAQTTPDYRLADLGGYPALVPGGVLAVHGEIYDVSDAELAALDELEEHPEYYRRERVRLKDGEHVMAYLLDAGQVKDCPEIASGNWIERTSHTEGEDR